MASQNESANDQIRDDFAIRTTVKHDSYVKDIHSKYVRDGVTPSMD